MWKGEILEAEIRGIDSVINLRSHGNILKSVVAAREPGGLSRKDGAPFLPGEGSLAGLRLDPEKIFIFDADSNLLLETGFIPLPAGAPPQSPPGGAAPPAPLRIETPERRIL
jgi:hypothetical protein